MSRSGLTHSCQDLRFSNENVQLLGGNFNERIFSRRELSSRRECYQDFASQQDSHRDPGEELFSLGGIPASTDFSAGFLPRYAVGIFPGKDPAGKTGHLGGIPVGSRWDPGERRDSWRDPGAIPVPILQGQGMRSKSKKCY